jgi:hypothetical protein
MKSNCLQRKYDVTGDPGTGEHPSFRTSTDDDISHAKAGDSRQRRGNELARHRHELLNPLSVLDFACIHIAL